MPISYKKLFDLLNEKGWTTYKIRKEKLIGQGTLTALKNGTGGLDSKTIARLCKILNCQPGDLMEYVPDKEDQGLAPCIQMCYIDNRKKGKPEKRPTPK